ncbi:MAG: 4-hydroxythreonine-4-phosphate dehydrogenase [Gemmatimonadetes bacterium]|nr:4-hydroxythreonine-4-phosphate dehydrogenase [Gemmatimonadota bacterium]MYD15340.1 4-hydroxythreonine-4-phosphate dehydrogenase [Gemmatimonadota bacterium]
MAHSPDVRVAVTLGDPRGIGPEVAARALAAMGTGRCAAWVLGPRECEDDFAGLGRYEAVGDGAGIGPGRAAGLAIERGVELALAGEADALVTAPVHKPALAAAGYHPGHTEMLMALAGAAEVGMVMCDEGGADHQRPAKRVLLATIHIPLRAVAEALTEDLLVSQTRLLGSALQHDWGLAEPRIALCALNPHASDDGMFGTAEREVYGPALERLSGGPSCITGPIPADTVFVRAFRGEFDAVVAPYHDVGMAAFKTAAFGRGVNVTIGLPFIRTSPDHGTAFDIAGKGVADPSSMLEALRLAIRLAGARRRNRARSGGGRE